MSDKAVRVEFDSPRPIRKAGAALIVGVEEEHVVFPESLTTPHLNSDGLAVAVTIPEWLAADRGLVSTKTDDACLTVGTAVDMIREDWFFLGATMAFVMRGATVKDAVWEGRKVAAHMMEQP